MIDSENNEQRFGGSGKEYQFEQSNPNYSFSETLEIRIQQELSEGMKKYMPIGSVIKLINFDGLHMIIGFNHYKENIKNDYIGCAYPFGLQEDSIHTYFDHSQIDRVYHIGYMDSFERSFKETLSDIDKPKNYGNE